MTLRQLITECTNRSDVVLDDSFWKTWINLSFQEISSQLRNIQDTSIRKKATDTTVASQANYTLPTGFIRPIKLWVGTTEYDRIDYEDSIESGLNNKYYIDESAGYYYLVPTPTSSGSTISFFYEKDITELSEDTDEAYFPARFHELLINGAMSRYHEYEKEMGKASYYRALFGNLLTELIDFYTRYGKDDVIQMKTKYDLSNTDF